MPNLIGTAPDQVPVNGFLGNMAFQNKEGVVTDLLSTTALTVTGAASFAGTIAAGLGSAAAPSYTFIGDTNTGIFSPAADTIAFSEGGVEAMRIDSSGNVGIGTASPGVRLSVVGDGRFTNTANTALNLGGGTGQAQVIIEGPSAATSLSLLQNGNGAYATQNGGTSGFNFRNTAGDYTFSTGAGNTERMRIAGAGNVGIGTASPGDLLHVAGNIRASGATPVIAVWNAAGSDRYGYMFGQAGSMTFAAEGASRPMLFSVAGSERMRLDTSGNLGIGTSSPTGRLQVSGTGYILNNANADPAGGVTIPNVGGTFLTYNRSAGLVDSEIIYGNTASSFLRFTSQSSAGVLTERMRITAAGDVGIGIATPDARLHLHSTAGGGDLPRMRFTNGGTGTAATDGMFVGISNTSQLDVWNFENDAVRVGTNNAERMRITGAGLVGIGTNAPAAPLHVASINTNSYGAFVASAIGVTRVGNGSRGALVDFGVGGGLFSNWYYNSSLDKAAAAGYSPRIDLWVTDGSIRFLGSSSVAADATIAWSERMRIDGTTGNVGIGTSSPGQKLSVAGSAIVTLGNSYFCYTNDYGIGTPDSNGLQVFASNGDVLRFGHRTGGTTFTEDMRIASNGNVGIGTTSPATKFVVSNGGAGGLEFDTNGLIQSYDRSTSAYQFMYFDAAQILFRPSGTERMRIDASGNVGIGTSAPISKFQVGTGYITSGSASSTNGARIIAGQWSGSDHLTTFGSEYSSGGPVLGYAVWPSTSATGSFISAAAAALQRGAYTISGNLHIWYGGGSQAVAVGSAVTTSERMRIDASGNLLVGGTSALQSAKITAYGSVAAQNGGVDGTFANAFVGVYSANSNEHNVIQTAVSSVGTGSGFRFRASLGGGSSTTYPVLDLTRNQTIFYTDNAERMRIASDGTTTLSIGGVSSTHQFNYNESGGEIQLIDSTGAGPILLDNVSGLARLYKVGTGAMSIGTTGANYLQFITNGSEAMRIISGGNVGIGTSTPGSFKLNVQGNAYTTTIAVGTDENLLYQSAANNLGFRVGTSTNTAYLNLKAASGVPQLDGAGGVLAFGTAGTERMRVDSSGNVGIGTSSPSFKLDVQGNSSSTATVVRSRNNDTSASSLAAFNCSTGQGVNAEWYSYSGANWFGTKSNHPQLFITNNTERARISAAGGFSVGTTTDAGVGNILASGNVTAYSDIRVKDNVEQITGALGRVQRIRGVTYTRTDLEDTERRYAGVIAQEIEEVLPEAIFDSGELKAVDYNATIGLLIEAIKELTARVAQLEGK